jgi:hypothetical protein
LPELKIEKKLKFYLQNNFKLQSEQFGTIIETQLIPGQKEVENLTNINVDAIQLLTD